jgi:uncharacterized protein involved in tolerance to divalent cations
MHILPNSLLIVLHCACLCMYVCMYIYIYVWRQNIPTNIIIKIISKTQEDTYRAISRSSIHKLQITHSISVIFKPCISGTTVPSGPRVRQLLPSAHGAAGYWLASRRSNGTPSVINHPLAKEIHQTQFHFRWWEHKQDIPTIRTRFPDKHVCLAAFWLRGMSGHWQEQ